MPSRRTLAILTGVLAAGAVLRLAYVRAQPAFDPSFARPMLDGAYYVDWAKGILAGSGPRGAFYLAPLYPYGLAAFFRVFGESYGLLALAQQGMVLATAVLLFAVARRAAGDAAGIAAAVLALGYSALLFFATKPVGEAPAILLLVLAIHLASREGAGASGASGFFGGLTGLARPNLLLVAVGLALESAASRRFRKAVLLAGGACLAVLPVTVRNFSASGHLVPVSSNGGITLYHGNGPGAVGVFTPAEGFSGDPLRQREEATARARAVSGEPLDDVEADRFFRSEAVRTRLRDPRGTVTLLGRRILLLFDDFEHGLDYAPAIDENPWRRGAPVSFAVIFGLAVAGAVSLGWRRTGGAPVWTALVACALTPVVFYASSRYRLPMSVLLTIPAGAGAAAILGLAPATQRRRWTALAAGAVCTVASLLVPSGALCRSEEAAALANRAVSFRQRGDAAAAEADLRRALARESSSPAVWYNLGVVLEGLGRKGEAESAYRRTVALDPGHVEAAGNLAALLVRTGRAEEAVPILRRALAARPGHTASWSNLVVALVATNRLEEARAAVRAAGAAGVTLDPGLVRAADPERAVPAPPGAAR